MKVNLRRMACCSTCVVLLFAVFFLGGREVDGATNITSVRYSNSIEDAAKNYDLSPALIAAVIHAESNFNPRARSRKGAKGLMQIVPGTQRYLRLKNAYDPIQNIQAGSRYLRELLDLFGGDISLALAAYNAGPYAVTRHDGIPPYRETQTYVKRVLAYYDLYKQMFDFFDSEREMS